MIFCVRKIQNFLNYARREYIGDMKAPQVFKIEYDQELLQMDHQQLNF